MGMNLSGYMYAYTCMSVNSWNKLNLGKNVTLHGQVSKVSFNTFFWNVLSILDVVYLISQTTQVGIWIRREKTILHNSVSLGLTEYCD